MRVEEICERNQNDVKSEKKKGKKEDLVSEAKDEK
jgi:hypothetical protein